MWPRLLPTWRSKLVGPHFERICREATLLRQGALGLQGVVTVGASVVADRAARVNHEVDVVATGATGEVVAVGEAKHTAWPRGTVDLARLDRIRALLPPIASPPASCWCSPQPASIASSCGPRPDATTSNSWISIACMPVELAAVGVRSSGDATTGARDESPSLRTVCSTISLWYILVESKSWSELRDTWAKAQSGSGQMAVVWGRRRVGKTFLLSTFAADLDCVFFTATRNDNETEQLGRLHEAAQRGLGDRAALAGGGFRDLESALKFFVEIAVDRPLILVIDEAPRLAAARADYGDVLASVWDGRNRASSLFMILCGSAVAAMRNLIGPDGGLYRRADIELRIDPLDPWAAAELLQRDGTMAADDVIAAYAALRRISTAFAGMERSDVGRGEPRHVGWKPRWASSARRTRHSLRGPRLPLRL